MIFSRIFEAHTPYNFANLSFILKLVDLRGIYYKEHPEKTPTKSTFEDSIDREIQALPSVEVTVFLHAGPVY